MRSFYSMHSGIMVFKVDSDKFKCIMQEEAYA